MEAGPDAQASIKVDVHQLQLTFCASELRLRGDTSIIQPHEDADGNILCWNGEVCCHLNMAYDRCSLVRVTQIFEGLDVSSLPARWLVNRLPHCRPAQIQPCENDGTKLFSALRSCHTADEVSRVFCSIEGP